MVGTLTHAHRGCKGVRFFYFLAGIIRSLAIDVRHAQVRSLGWGNFCVFHGFEVLRASHYRGFRRVTIVQGSSTFVGDGLTFWYLVANVLRGGSILGFSMTLIGGAIGFITMYQVYGRS